MVVMGCIARDREARGRERSKERHREVEVPRVEFRARGFEVRAGQTIYHVVGYFQLSDCHLNLYFEM